MTGEHRVPSSYPSVVPERAWLASLLMRHHERFFPRFVAAVARLRFVPRGLRRRMQRKAAVTLAGAAVILALGAANFGPPGASVVHAANINVANGEVALDVGNGACSLIEAVLNANADGDLSGGDCVAGSGADIIVLPTNGSFTFTASYTYSSGSNGLPVVDSTITIAGNGSTIDLGGSAVGIRLANVTATGDLTISDTTITSGYLHDATYGGGVLRVDGGDLTVTNSTLRDSETNSYGGAIHAVGGTLNVTNESVITGNDAYRGGGILSNGSDISVTLSTVSYNFAERGGGGIFAENGSLSIANSTINNNEGQDYGGGILAHGADLSIFGSTFDSNEAGYAGGGGVRVQDSDDVTIERSTFSDNNSSGGGGGISVGGFSDSGAMPATATITNSTFSNNYAYSGGGVLLSAGSLTLNNVTVTGNGADGSGGGIYAGRTYYDELTNTLTLNRTLVSGNVSEEGAEVYAGLDSEYSDSPIVNVNNFNLFGHDGLTNSQALGGIVTPGATDITATSNGAEPTALADILSGALALNAPAVFQILPDPETKTHALSANSPAVDRAPNTACAAAPVSGIDQRGEPRNIDIPGVGNNANANLCDIGAYELQSQPGAGICPAEADNAWTDILGIGMGSPKKHKNIAKIVIPNAADVVALYGQLAGNNDGNANYVRFMAPGKNNYVQVDSVTSPAPRPAATFWYGSSLEPTSNVRGRWFLQPNGAKKHIPRAFVLYPTYETDPDEQYVNVFELLHPVDTQVHWDVAGGWIPSRQIVVELPPPSAATTLTVKLALVGNDKDNRPIYLTVTAGGVSQMLQPTKPDHGDQLNILTFTLEGVPAGTDEIVIDIVSPDPFNSELGSVEGDSAALVGMTANYYCEPTG